MFKIPKLFTESELDKRLKNNNFNLNYVDSYYKEFGNIGRRTLVIKYYCEKHDYYGEYRTDNYTKSLICPKCISENRTTKTLENTRPDIIKYLANKNDAKLNTWYKGKVMAKCLDCGHEKHMFLSNLINIGISCPKCSDGIPYGEKVIANLLSELDLNFIHEKTFDWSNNKRYDFYVLEYNLIIEIHGEQHYQDCNLTTRTLKEEQDNDKFKETNAINNGLNYIALRYGKYYRKSMSLFKSEIENKLIKHLKIEHIDLDKIFQKSLRSNIVLTAELYKNGHKAKEISKILHIGIRTVNKYLNIGSELNLCEYTNDCYVKVYQYDLNNNFIAEYKTISEASRVTGVGTGNISSVCSGKRNSAGGFIWKRV